MYQQDPNILVFYIFIKYPCLSNSPFLVDSKFVLANSGCEAPEPVAFVDGSVCDRFLSLTFVASL